MFSFLNDPLSATLVAGLAALTYLSSLAVYRLYFHELARFPGPKLAALSKWYDFYYDVYLKGQFVFKLQELHDQYGPIIRIAPDELHISDPDFYVDFFTKQGPQSKYAWAANRFNNGTSVFATVPPDHHKLRRRPLEPMFARAQIRQLLPMLQEKVAKMLTKFRKYQANDKVVRLDRACMALSEDMIFEYGFGICRDALDKPDFKDPLHEVFVQAGSAGVLSLHFPLLPKIINALPDSVIMKLQPDFMPLIKVRKDFELELAALQDDGNIKSRNPKAHRTVMLDLLNDPDLPPSEKTAQRHLDEAQAVIGAGLSTTGWAATVGIYHILANPAIVARLRDELYTMIPQGAKREDCTDLDWAALEALPYLQACIRECLRLSYGMSARNSRVTHKEVIYTESAQYAALPPSSSDSDGDNKRPSQGRTWHIPAYTPVSMSIPLVNHNEHVFPDSRSFNPDRWLGPNKVPERYFVSFSKGTRMCLGMQLAWAELSLMLAGLVRWFDFELYETDERSVKMGCDVTIPVPASNDGVRASVKAELD